MWTLPWKLQSEVDADNEWDARRDEGAERDVWDARKANGFEASERDVILSLASYFSR